MAITYVKVRATIITDDYEVSTPYIQSIDVTRSRGQMGVFSAGIKIPRATPMSKLGNITILAGVEGNQQIIFRGYVKRIRIQPSFDDPNFVLVKLEGADVLDRLTNNKFTRREATQKHVWATVNSVIRQSPPDPTYQFSWEDASAYSQPELEQNNVVGPKEPPRFGSATGGAPLPGIPILITESEG